MNKTYIYKEYKLKNDHILEIFQDTWAESPRSWDNQGTMAIFHKRYNFGDEIDFTSYDFENWTEMENYIKNNLKAVVCLPIFMYDHSGITIQTESFACPWDSGQVGFIYVTEDKVKEEYNKTNITEDIIEIVIKNLKNEVEIMNQYLMGEVYGFHILKKELGKENITIESCSGFYGDDIRKNGMIDHIPKELIPEHLTF